jgi:hypothetical protein
LTATVTVFVVAAFTAVVVALGGYIK